MIANQIVVHMIGVVIWIPPLQPVASSLKTILPPPEPTVLVTLLFLGDSSSLPEIETLWVNKSEADSVPHKRVKTSNVDKEHAAKITEARLAIAMCELQVLSVQAFLKDLEVWLLKMVWFIREQFGELEQLKRVFNKLDKM